MTHANPVTPNRLVDVPVIARVEGEGALHLGLRGDEIVDLRLEIYEPPRFFEAFLAGRHFSEVPDIVPRICGICPVAYQMSAIHALEDLFEVQVPAGTRELRRLLYCAEWIESHMLHVHLLAAPDLLGYDSAIEMAQRERGVVERGLRIKRLGNDLLALIGGREIHPVSPRVGGFSRAPRPRELRELAGRFEDALVDIHEVTDWVRGLPAPVFSPPTELVAMRHPSEYPMNAGRLVSTGGRTFDARSFEGTIEELHVPHSNALHARFVGGDGYMVGPLARINLNADRLTPVAGELAARLELVGSVRDRFASMGARVVETALALEESARIIRDYEPPDPPAAEVHPRAGRGCWVTEAPRGILYHRYDVDADGIVREARIVPPTSQNLRHMESDLRAYIPRLLDGTDDELALGCEMLVRTYDPCISCATHFLRLEVRREEGACEPSA